LKVGSLNLDYGRNIPVAMPTYHYRFVHAERLGDEAVVQKTTTV
jgi:hypothetical protein